MNKSAAGFIRYAEWVSAGARRQEMLRERLRGQVEAALRGGGVDVDLATYHYDEHGGEQPVYETDDAGQEHRIGFTIIGSGPVAEWAEEGHPA